MQKPWATELALLLAIVFYGNSLILICDHFLISHTLTMLVTLVSLTCCFRIIVHTLRMNESFQAQYWNFFNLMTVYLATNRDGGDGMNPNFFYRGWITFLLGFTILIFYTSYTWVRFLRQWQGQEPRPPNPKYVVSLSVSISCLFMGNGVAIMGRWFIPSESFEGMIARAGIMFLISMSFFCNYYFHSSVRPESFLRSTV